MTFPNVRNVVNGCLFDLTLSHRNLSQVCICTDRVENEEFA